MVQPRPAALRKTQAPSRTAVRTCAPPAKFRVLDHIAGEPFAGGHADAVVKVLRQCAQPRGIAQIDIHAMIAAGVVAEAASHAMGEIAQSENGGIDRPQHRPAHHAGIFFIQDARS